MAATGPISLNTCARPTVMTNGRDHRIDFFRGLAPIFIFWDHVPANPAAAYVLMASSPCCEIPRRA
ncbi:OpgC domain-containing protein [Pseudomonas petrae]|uniref:OpgC domain-containing protein n=1 Tax=Pseudomonas petrae TaxID=2912190 RepID=UPI003B00D87F